VWKTVDPEGQIVVLTEERWRHIVFRHRELTRRSGPSRWIKVVVHYESDRGEIMTAFPRRWFP
jgi:hypothetical protein